MAQQAEIAGAGLAGLALAAGLGRLGWSVRVHEAADEPRATGGGLYMTRDGLEALEILGAFDRLKPHLIHPAGYETRIDGRLHSRDVNDGSFCTTLRQLLHETLQGAARDAGVEIVTRSRVVAAEAGGVLRLESGQALAADLVVAADGVGSRIAESVGIKVDRVRFDDSLIRVLLDRRMLTGPEWDDAVDLWNYGGRPLRVLFSPCSATQCYLVMMAPASDIEGAALPIDAALWTRYFPELGALLGQSLVRARIDRYGSVRLDSWVRGRVAIVGDAAHAMPSSIGKGANLGIRNAVALAETLASGSDIDIALAAWQRRQRPIIDAAQEIAERVALARTLTADPTEAAYEIPLVGTV
jgi:2-methyl-3-hydroxypyridine 5-carboxylic acid dioxygenase